MKLSTWLTLLAGAVIATGSASTAWAQAIERGKFDLNLGGGAILHPNSSALQSVSPVLNLKGRFFLSENIGFGFSVDYARTETDDDIFPLAQFRFSLPDSTTFVALRQPVTLLHYQVQAVLGTSVGGGTLFPYVSGGIGGYTIYLDPQQADGPTRQSDLLLSFGGAIKLKIAGTSSFELAVRDVIYTSYDRDELDPTPQRICRQTGELQFLGDVCPNERFPGLDPERSDPNWSGPQSTIHNIVLTASFSFIPGR